MLRITATPEPEGASKVTLKLEGRIVSDWADALGQECKAWLRRGFAVEMDFSQVSYVDNRGIRTLRELLEAVQFRGCSSVIADLLKGEDST